MAWFPISHTMPQYVDTNGDPYSGAVLKAYSAGTSTNINMATDSTGGTTASSVALNSDGYPEVSSTIVIPHINEKYKLSLYATQAAADANTGALWTQDNIAVSIDFGSTTQDISTSTVLDASDNFNHLVFTGTITITLPDIDVVGSGYVFSWRNDGSGVVTFDGNGAETINGAATQAAGAGTGGWMISGDTTWSLFGDKDAQINKANTFTGAQTFSGAATFSGDVTGVAPDGYKHGGILSVGTDTDHDIDFTAALAADSTNAIALITGALTKKLDASWVTGTDQGGLSSSLTIANSTWYHCFIITVAGVDDIGFDTSFTAANLVTDHTATKFRWIGAVQTDGSANIISFVQVGRSFLWSTPLNDISTTLGTTAASYTLSVPTGLKVNALFDSSAILAAGADILFSSLDNADQAVSETHAQMTNNANGDQAGGQFNIRTNTSAQIRARAGTASTTIDIWTTGWEIGEWV